MDPLLDLLSQLGLGLATNTIYDLLKPLALKPLEQNAIMEQIQNRIDLNGVSMRAETVISALAQNGLLLIEGSNIYAQDSLVFGSKSGTAIVGNSSTLQTAKTSIITGQGASIQTKDNAQVRQNSDGSITFHIGNDGGISFNTGGNDRSE